MPNRTTVEYAVQDLLDEGVYCITRDKGEALSALYANRIALEVAGIPEENWPILLERTVEVYWGSWRHLDD